MQAVFRNAMKIGVREEPPPPLDDGSFWLVDTSTGDRFLRPQWFAPWAANKAAWLDEAITRFQNIGHKISHHMTQQEIEHVIVPARKRTCYSSSRKTPCHSSSRRENM